VVAFYGESSLLQMQRKRENHKKLETLEVMKEKPKLANKIKKPF
jgi:hypothetical protein